MKAEGHRNVTMKGSAAVNLRTVSVQCRPMSLKYGKSMEPDQLSTSYAGTFHTVQFARFSLSMH
jgi:hypothetical protein